MVIAAFNHLVKKTPTFRVLIWRSMTPYLLGAGGTTDVLRCAISFNMTESVVTSFEELHAAVATRGMTTIYRGVRNSNYQLIPKIGRNGNCPLSAEKGTLQLFQIHATPYLPTKPQSEWEWLFIAQHHGLATRLLDWTRNPLVAAFFAVEGEDVGPSAIYVSKANRVLKETDCPDPFTLSTPTACLPRHINLRIAAQAGIFTAQPDPCVPLQMDPLDKIIIPVPLRASLRRMLFRYQVHRGSLFPDLDGQAAFIEWYAATRDEWINEDPSVRPL